MTDYLDSINLNRPLKDVLNEFFTNEEQNEQALLRLVKAWEKSNNSKVTVNTQNTEKSQNAEGPCFSVLVNGIPSEVEFCRICDSKGHKNTIGIKLKIGNAPALAGVVSLTTLGFVFLILRHRAAMMPKTWKDVFYALFTGPGGETTKGVLGKTVAVIAKGVISKF